MATSYNLNITQGSEFYVRFQAKDADGDPINKRLFSEWRSEETLF